MLQPIFDAFKPEGESGFVHAGKVGAGHFAKMVHNGIEYGMMQAYAEGWELLEATPLVTDVRKVFESWQQGTVIRSWLLDLRSARWTRTSTSSKLRGYAQDSGEGRWTVRGGHRPRRAAAGRSPRRCSRGSPRGRTTRRR